MPKDAIGLGESGRLVNEEELTKIIINHLSKGDNKLVSIIISYHLEEIKNISRALINVLGGQVISARTLNACFYETVRSLGYTTSHLCLPHSNNQVTNRFAL